MIEFLEIDLRVILNLGRGFFFWLVCWSVVADHIEVAERTTRRKGEKGEEETKNKK